MKGYLNREAETNETLSNGWLHSGDLGYMDDDGYFYIVDRKKDMINREGEKVYPKEVENVLTRLEGVSEAAVVGRPDEKYGEEVVAFIVKNDKTLTEGDVSEFCKKRIASYKCPKEIVFVDALPRNSIGKILKVELRKRLIRQTVEKFVHV
jgi:long-chain acyl-CoA synthetase